MLAAEAVEDALAGGRANDELMAYENAWRASDIGRDLYKVRNVKALWSRLGLAVGVSLGGFDMWTHELFGGSLFGALKLTKPDSATLKPIAEARPIAYPKPDGVLTFDKLSSVFLSNTNHEEDQPVHLRLIDPAIPIKENLPRYGEPARLYCPAEVYEVVYGDEKTHADPRFVINAQNCVHCKTCDIRIRRRTSSGLRRKEAEAPTIPICRETGATSPGFAVSRGFGATRASDTQ